MKSLGTIIAALFLATVLVLYMCSYRVRFTEVAIVKTWGNPAKDAVAEPGLYWKWPAPIQQVVRYDKRMRILEDKTEETRTVDGKNVILTTYALWRISDPVKFHTNFPASVEDGEKKLRSTIVTHKHAVVGKRPFSQFVSIDPNERKLDEIEQEILSLASADAQQQYGIEVTDFGIKKLGLPSSVTTAIFESMKQAETNKADRYRTEGEARARDILAEANAARQRIMSVTREKVASIHRDAQQIVSGYYKEFDQYPELRIFLDKLQASIEALKSRSTIIINTSEPPFDVFDPNYRAGVMPSGEKVAGDGKGEPE